jgi:diphosphomevalonate decarboxylase
MRDAILIVSPGKKEVSSSAGHQLMDNHPYQTGRLDQVKKHLEGMLAALRTGDWDAFTRVAETEALSLHALMMSSDPSFMLLKPGSIEIIRKIRAFREQFHFPVCFTLDAGPNIHLLYPGKHRESVVEFIRNELTGHCNNGEWIDDKQGKGPVRLK